MALEDQTGNANFTKFNLVVIDLLRLRYSEVKYDGPILVDPKAAQDLVDSMR